MLGPRVARRMAEDRAATLPNCPKRTRCTSRASYAAVVSPPTGKSNGRAHATAGCGSHGIPSWPDVYNGHHLSRRAETPGSTTLTNRPQGTVARPGSMRRPPGVEDTRRSTCGSRWPRTCWPSRVPTGRRKPRRVRRRCSTSSCSFRVSPHDGARHGWPSCEFPGGEPGRTRRARGRTAICTSPGTWSMDTGEAVRGASPRVGRARRGADRHHGALLGPGGPVPKPPGRSGDRRRRAGVAGPGQRTVRHAERSLG